MGKTAIEYADESSNPIRAIDIETGRPGWACVKVSPGCNNCYAERINQQYARRKLAYGTGRAYTVPNLEQVRFELNEAEFERWKRMRKPRRIFPFDMTDLFGEWVPDGWISKSFDAMRAAPLQTFLVLTKRARRMLDFCQDYGPLPDNVWMGVSAEDQRRADERIPLLLLTPARVRWVSLEPLLRQVDLVGPWPNTVHNRDWLEGDPSIDWVVVGGESGLQARPMHPDGVRSLRDQCGAAVVPFFFKQWGEWLPNSYGDKSIPPDTNFDVKHLFFDDGLAMAKVGKKLAGRLLDGREWNQMPE